MAINVDDEINQLPDAGAYPQDDGSVDVVLDEPLVRGDGTEIYKIKLIRAPTAGEINKAGGRAMLLQMYDAAACKVLPAISDPPITERIYDQLSAFDQQNLIMGIVSFFGKSKRGGTMLG